MAKAMFLKKFRKIRIEILVPMQCFSANSPVQMQP